MLDTVTTSHTHRHSIILNDKPVSLLRLAIFAFLSAVAENMKEDLIFTKEAGYLSWN
ncbi:hypothetical protein KRIGEM_01929 [Komagataeibacter rhaeticus]|nr:hypothetical protein KRIGEM_01929 [Komagataeibacter rhaeticus]